MSEEIKDYRKCQIANKFTLAGHILMGASLPLGVMEYQTDLMPLATSLPSVLFGWISLAVTDYGKDTFEKYREAKDYIGNFNYLPKNFIDKANRNYCHRKGVELAVRENGLEDLLENND